jgi:hypothetical protein
MNTAVGPKGLVPALLVLGQIPRLPAVSMPFPDVVARLKNLTQLAQNMLPSLHVVALPRLYGRSRLLPPTTSSAQACGVTPTEIDSSTGPDHTWLPKATASASTFDVGEKIGPRPFNISIVKPAPLMDNEMPTDGIGSASQDIKKRHAICQDDDWNQLSVNFCRS